MPQQLFNSPHSTIDREEPEVRKGPRDFLFLPTAAYSSLSGDHGRRFFRRVQLIPIIIPAWAAQGPRPALYAGVLSRLNRKVFSVLLLTTRPSRMMAGGQEQHRKKKKEEERQVKEGGQWKFLIFFKGERMNTEEGASVAQELVENVFIETAGSNLKLVGMSREVTEEQLLFFGKKRRRGKVELSPRDFEVLEFIIDMKFAGCGEIFEKFFSRVGSERTLASSTEWTRKRLRQLEAVGLLRTDVGIGIRDRVYFATFKGCHAVNLVHPETLLAKPNGGLDYRTFVHDRELLLVRLEYERNHQGLHWISDRKLRMGLRSPRLPSQSKAQITQQFFVERTLPEANHPMKNVA